MQDEQLLLCSFGLNQKNQKFKAAWPRFAAAQLGLNSAKLAASLLHFACGFKFFRRCKSPNRLSLYEAKRPGVVLGKGFFNSTFANVRCWLSAVVLVMS
jgi:hypothetical protein